MPFSGGETNKKGTFLLDQRLLLTIFAVAAVWVVLNIATYRLFSGAHTTAPGKTAVKASTNFKALPIYFLANDGQLDKQVRFFALGAGYGFYLTDAGVTYTFSKKMRGLESARRAKVDSAKNQTVLVLKLSFPGANGDVKIEGGKAAAAKINYFKGADAEHWKTNIRTFRSVVYKSLYDGIDLSYRGDQGHLKYEFLVAPGADYKKIRVRYAGANKLAVNPRGDLVIQTEAGNLLDKRPKIYQQVGKQKRWIKGGFVVNGNDVAYRVGDYDSRYRLVIDPGLVYSTFIGGGSSDSSVDLIALDTEGNSYVTGYASSANFPVTAGAFDTTQNGGVDIFVSKLNSSGTALMFSTYLGGLSNDYGYGLALDSSKNVFVTGYTNSTDLPVTPGAFDATAGPAPETFVTKLRADGAALLYSTYLGGSGSDYGYSLSPDAAGNLYVAGYTSSSDFPTTPGAFDQTFNGANDAFLVGVNAAGTALSYSTYLGGGGSDYGYSLAMDGAENIYMTGYTFSSGFPITGGAYDNSYNGLGDVFVTKFDKVSLLPAYSTFVGGTAADYGYSIAVDSSQNAYVSGKTGSANFPVTAGAFDQSHGGGYDAFLAKLGSQGTSMAFSTFLGSPGDDVAYGLAVDSQGAAYLSGFSNSATFPTTPGSFDSSANGGYDAFMAKVGGAGDSLLYGTYFGGSGSDFAYSLAVDAAGKVFVTGQTNSLDFPITPGVFDNTNSGLDAFVGKFDILPPTTALETSPTAPDGQNNWFKSLPQFTLSRDESGSTFWQWDTTAGPWAPYSSPFNGPNGERSLYFYSSDLAGNLELTNIFNAKVDIAPPIDPTPGSSSHGIFVPSNDNTIDMVIPAGTDSVSGVDGYALMWSRIATDTPPPLKNTDASVGTTTSGGVDDGAWFFHARTVDKAGNWSSGGTAGPYLIDTVAPVSDSSTNPVAPTGNDDWFNAVPHIGIGANETAAIKYQWDSTSGPWGDYYGPVLGLEGLHTVFYQATDLAGNTETARFRSLKVDATVPTTVTAAGSSPGANRVDLSWAAATDTISGVDGYRVISLDTSAQLAFTYAESFSVVDLSPGTLYRYLVKAVDGAGNAGAGAGLQVITGSNAPVAPLLVGFTGAANEVYLYLRPTSNNSGISGYKVYSGDNGTLIGTTAGHSYPVTGLPPGDVYSFYVKTVDASGTTSGPSRLVRLDPGSVGNTPAGSGVAGLTVSPHADVSVDFADVIASGETSAATQTVLTVEPPSGYVAVGPQHDIQTSAAFTAPVLVALRYDPTRLRGDERELRLLHYKSGGWQEITLYVDTGNNLIVGRTNGLSPFLIAELAPPLTGVNKSTVLALAALLAMSGLIINKKIRPPKTGGPIFRA